MLYGKSQKELLRIARTLIQPLLAGFHKGQAGKIAVFGGCEDYTGAPFFAAHSAALVGADLSHIVCEKAAAPVIKGYSPDLMVHPYLYELGNPDMLQIADRAKWDEWRRQPLADALALKELTALVDKHILPRVMLLVERLDAFVVGPGAGRDPLMLKTLERVIQEVIVANKPMVLDADALFLLSVRPQLLKGCRRAVITPNVVEFARLCSALSVPDPSAASAASAVSHALGGVVVVKKGEHELIARGDDYIVNDMPGLLRRVGGQGDTLTGSLVTLLVWALHYSQKMWLDGQEISGDDAMLVACYSACALVRCASAKAFAQHRRAMQTSNVHAYLGESYLDLFEEVTFSDKL